MQAGTDISIGERIKQMRLNMGFSLFDLAIATKTNRGLISRIEQGKRECSEEMLYDIIEFFKHVSDKTCTTDEEMRVINNECWCYKRGCNFPTGRVSGNGDI